MVNLVLNVKVLNQMAIRKRARVSKYTLVHRHKNMNVSMPCILHVSFEIFQNIISLEFKKKF